MALFHGNSKEDLRLIAQAYQTGPVRLCTSPFEHLDDGAIVCFQGVSSLDRDRARGIICIGECPVSTNREKFAWKWKMSIMSSSTRYANLRQRDVPFSLGPTNAPPVIGATIRVPRGPCPRKIIPVPVIFALYRYVSPGDLKEGSAFFRESRTS